VFYWDIPPDGSYSSPIPLYGRITSFYAAAQAAAGGGPNLYIADKIYISADVNNLMQSATNKFLYDRAFNEFVCWGERIADAAVGKPSLSMGRYTLLDTDPNSAANSWRRTLLLEPDLFKMLPSNELAQTVAALTGHEFANRDHSDVSITMRGQEQLSWGMVVQPKLSGSYSDTTLGLNGINFRGTRVTHDLDFGNTSPDPFQTTVMCRSLSASGF
jgi:hypothetical protein